MLCTVTGVVLAFVEVEYFVTHSVFVEGLFVVLESGGQLVVTVFGEQLVVMGVDMIFALVE